MIKRHLSRQWGFSALAILVASTFTLTAGCIFSPDEKEPEPDPPDPIPTPTIPDNVIAALEVIYNDKTRGANERFQAYENLFPPADDDSLSFIFFFQPDDIEPGEEGSWGLAGELEAHRNMFRAQEEGQIYSLELRIQRQPPEELEFPQPGQENWVQIFATNVNLRLMFNPNDGLLVDGGQAEFKLAPKNNRWYMTEWKDLPRP
jgi:hypothetical protein